MLPVFADPETDFVFKRIFGAAERKPLLVALLEDACLDRITKAVACVRSRAA